MKRLSSKLWVLVTVVVMAGSTAASIIDDSTLSQLTDYRHWTKINSEAVKVETQVSAFAVTSAGISTPV